MDVAWWRTLRTRFDWVLAAATATMITCGLLNLWSAIRDRHPDLLVRQFGWLAVAIGLFIGAASFDYRRLARVGYVPYACGLAVLTWVLLAGRSAGGARRWLEIGPMSTQPSEMMKVLLIIALAKHIRDAPSVRERTLRHLFVPLALAGAPMLLVAAQPDLSTALIMGLIFATVLLTARLSLKTWALIVVVGLAALLPVWKWGMRDYQRNRVLAFVNPALDPATAWQPMQARNAVGSGRLLGRGYLHGTQVRARALPALWTDFPFAVWGEEWGFLGSAFVLLVYAWLILWVLKISREARDRFGAILCIGTAAMLFWQIMFNLGMVTGLMPVAGVTLPLISYGGSSLFTVMTALGLVMNVSLRRYSYD